MFLFCLSIVALNIKLYKNNQKTLDKLYNLYNNIRGLHMSYEKNLEKFYDQKLAIPKSKEMYKIGREDAKSYFNKTLRKNKNIFSRFSSRKKIDLIRNAIDRFYDLKEYFDGVYINKIRSVLNNADNYFEYFESSKNDDKKSAINLIEQDTLETIKNLQNDKQNILN